LVSEISALSQLVERASHVLLDSAGGGGDDTSSSVRTQTSTPPKSRSCSTAEPSSHTCRGAALVPSQGRLNRNDDEVKMMDPCAGSSDDDDVGSTSGMK
jgi:hypothetical protein